MTVITDLVDFHRGWTFSQADLVVAPTERARKVALRRRVPADRVKLLGLPVDLRFRPPAPGEKQALRRRFGLDEHRFTILVMGGAAGVGHLAAQVRMLASERQPWQLVVVCGRNEKLRRRLYEIEAMTPMLVLGFVDYMPELMRACDLVVTKAGPGAIAEALATGVPLVITGFLPGGGLARRGARPGGRRTYVEGDVAPGRGARTPVCVFGHCARLPAPGCALQGVGAGEPVSA